MSDPKPIVILGSTGSIGRQTLEVVKALPHRLRVVGLAAHSNVELFAQQIAEWQPAIAALGDEGAAHQLRATGNLGVTRLVAGLDGVREVATWDESELVLGAMLGAAGLGPTLAAIEAGKNVAIANKETLVAAGSVVMAAVRKHGTALLPVDSEHSAIAQCLLGEAAPTIRKLTITASGGPFVDTPRETLAEVKAAQALKHPTWAMGQKITVDSATLMNKTLESIEAHWLFDIPMRDIEVVVHRQSIIHSLVTFCDNSVKAQLGVPDMRLPIQWALLHPERVQGTAPALNLSNMGPLTFEAPDAARFPALALGRQAMEAGGTTPAAMNAANEVAVHEFLRGATSFYGITDCIASVLERHTPIARPGLEEIYAADTEARRLAREFF